jgi:hypothetical protein
MWPQWAERKGEAMLRKLSFCALIASAMTGAFISGQASKPSAASAAKLGRVFVARQGDVIRVPSAQTRCEASEEAGVANLFLRPLATARALHRRLLQRCASRSSWPRYGRVSRPLEALRTAPVASSESVRRGRTLRWTYWRPVPAGRGSGAARATYSQMPTLATSAETRVPRTRARSPGYLPPPTSAHPRLVTSQ